MNNTITFAFTGKGGVGKTSISAIFTRILMEEFPDKKILAIDADPAVGLSTALGIKVKLTVDEIRNLVIRLVKEGKSKDAIELLGESKYQILNNLTIKDNLSFLAIGRPESSGCYCKVNSYLKEVISLLSKNYDFVIIDGEAGIEQVNRRVMENITHLILISDGSKKGIEVIKTINKVATRLKMYKNSYVILNRVINEDLTNNISLDRLKLISVIKDDKNMTYLDMNGDSIFNLSKDSLIYVKCREIIKSLGIIKE